MYIELTTRCNMICSHCIRSCTEQGEDMSMDNFKACLEVSSVLGSVCNIGGGEPTIHPQFMEMLKLAIATLPRRPAVITNGSMKDISLEMAAIARTGRLRAHLSLDKYHDRSMVSDEVVAAYSRTSILGQAETWVDNTDPRGILSAEGWEYKGGRCTIGRTDGPCVCLGPFINVKGVVRVCGCPDSGILGNISNAKGCRSWPFAKCGKEVTT